MDFRIHRFERVESTMSIAAGMPVGSVVIADEQTAGIGRHGHSWSSEKGAGLYVSVVLPPHPALTLALGLAAVQAVAESTGVVCDLRWPNDLMLGDRKLGGILARSEGETAVVGIGINITARAFPPELARVATSLALETDLEFRAEDILTALLPAIKRFTALTTPEIIREWERASSYARGKAVQVDIGERVLSGVTAGLDASGFLRVRQPDGSIETVIAGGVRPAATTI